MKLISATNLIRLLLIVTLAPIFIVSVWWAIHASGNEHLVRSFQISTLRGYLGPHINDHHSFDTRPIAARGGQPWPKHTQYNQENLSPELRRVLTESKSSAYLVIKDGEILTEHYFHPYGRLSKTNSFSIAKTINTLLVGAAIDDGLIESFDTPVTHYVPELNGYAEGVTLANLSAMTSGMIWQEVSLSPLSQIMRLLYGYDVDSVAMQQPFYGNPGSKFNYSSASTQLLGLALKRALNGRLLSDYLSEKFWQPMGMNDSGLWHTDANGNELVFCCISTNARNYAKFGQLLMQQGIWQEKTLIFSDFVKRMLAENIEPYYGHSVWRGKTEAVEYSALMGHFGQYVIMVPSENMVIVRLGEKRHPDFMINSGPDILETEVRFYVEASMAIVSMSLASLD
ncbi:hypothetical protein R50073_41820 [Maricurvus nonylphenolicus]|uniref:serine hydrolase domain-containing protein n=1 Tax=Maricurvus nonylphenolicus TaxID=1008307 RepID=UPI0036F3D2F3